MTPMPHSPGASRSVGDQEESIAVLRWRAERLQSLGVDALLAVELAHAVDWHELAGLVERGCPPDLALRILL